MKIGAALCVLLAIGWSILALAQLWFVIVTAEVFFKISVSAALIFLMILGASLTAREYLTEKRQKRDGYID